MIDGNSPTPEGSVRNIDEALESNESSFKHSLTTPCPPRKPDGSIDGDRIDWDQLIPKLLLIASSQIRRNYRTIGGTMVAEDLVQEAILRTLNDQRKWKDGIGEIRHFECVMESILFEHVRKITNTNSVSLDEIDDNDDTGSSSGTAAGRSKLAQYLIEKGESAPTIYDAMEYRERLLEMLSDDPLQQAIARIGFDDGIVSPTELSQILGVSRARIRRAAARLLGRHLEIQRNILGEVLQERVHPASPRLKTIDVAQQEIRGTVVRLAPKNRGE